MADALALQDFQTIASDGSQIPQAGCRFETVEPHFGLPREASHPALKLAGDHGADHGHAAL